ncbi:MAG TPA: prenyltransferase [Actinophytocola sp.]|jgi:1,4-dihydroxy-2-naphthoate octaprenyltransferase|nr:prenyltransferase [Actinophytocola sp.]
MTETMRAVQRRGGTVGAWVQAAGPPLILVIVLQAGYGLTIADRIAPLAPSRVALTLALFVLDAIGRRLINDYEDHRRGLDSVDTVRPDSSLALGLDMRRVRAAGMTCFGLAWVLAAYLALTIQPWILLLAVACYAAYFAYAGGPRPLGHRGLGELIDFVVTGTAVTLLVVLANVGRVDLTGFLGALGPGFLFCALMLHNNARDVPKDSAHGKTTLPKIIGLTPTKVLYAVGVTGFYTVVVVVAASWSAPWLLLPLLTAPWAAYVVVAVARATEFGESMISWARLYFVMIANFALFTVGGVLS